MCAVWILFCVFGIVKSSPAPSQRSAPNLSPWPPIVVMPAYPFLPIPLNNELLSFNNTGFNYHNNNATNTTNGMGKDYRLQVDTTDKPELEISTETIDITSGEDQHYTLPIDTVDKSNIKEIDSTEDDIFETGKSNTWEILTESTEVDKDYVSSIDTTEKLQTNKTVKTKDFPNSTSKNEEAVLKTGNKQRIGYIKEKWLPYQTTGNVVKDKATEFINRILHKSSNLAHSTINKHVTKIAQGNDSKVFKQGANSEIINTNNTGNELKQFKSTAAQLRIISKAMECDTERLKNCKKNKTIVLRPDKSTINKNDTHEEIIDIYETRPFVNNEVNAIKKLDYNKIQINDTDLLSILFPTYDFDSQKISLHGNNSKEDKFVVNVKEASVIDDFNINTKPVTTERNIEGNLQEHMLTHDIQNKVTETITASKKGVTRRRKNKTKMPEVTFSSFIPIFKPRRKSNRRKNEMKNRVSERHSASNDDVDSDVKVFNIPNRENIQNIHKDNAQNQNFNTIPNFQLNSQILTGNIKNDNAINIPQCQNQDIGFKSQIVDSSDGKKLVVFKPEKVSLCNVYEDFLEKLTMTVLVPFHVYKLTNS